MLKALADRTAQLRNTAQRAAANLTTHFCFPTFTPSTETVLCDAVLNMHDAHICSADLAAKPAGSLSPACQHCRALRTAIKRLDML